MKYLLIFSLALTAAAQQKMVVSTQPVKATDYATKKALAIESDGMYTCPDNYEMFARRVKPEKPDKNTQAGDYESYFHIPEGNVIRETPENRVNIGCFEEK